MLDPPPTNREFAKYTLFRQGLCVRSASIAVLSWNLPSRLGADVPRATITLRANSLPSLMVAPPGPAGLTNVATQTSPNVFFVPAGSSDDSDPANRRPSASHASTGSPAVAVRTCARAANGEVSSGYPGTSELLNDVPPFSER